MSTSAATRDVVGIDDGLAARTGRVDDAVLVADRVGPPQRVRHEAVWSQVGDVESRLAQQILAGGERRADRGQGPEAGAEGGEQHDPAHPGGARGVDHDLGLGGALAGVQQKHAVDAVEGCGDAVGVVEISDGDVDAIGEEVGARCVTDEGAHVVALSFQEVDDAAADVASRSGDEKHEKSFRDRLGYQGRSPSRSR